MIPYAEVAARGACLDGAVARRLPAQTEALQLLRSCVQSLERRQASAFRAKQARWPTGTSSISLRLLSPSHARLGETGLSAVASARLDAAIEHIATRFQEPGLTAAAVARSQGVSPRYLQRLLESSERRSPRA